MKLRLKPTRFQIIYANGRKRSFSNLWFVAALLSPLIFFFSVILLDSSMPHYLTQYFSSQQHRDAFNRRIYRVSRSSTLNLLHSKHVSQTSELPTYHISVPQNTLIEMQKAIRKSQYLIKGDDTKVVKPYFKAYFSHGETKLQKCKIRIRGFSTWHHQPEKPSIRVKFTKDGSFEGRRYLELQRPEDIIGMKNWLPDQLAQELGLLCEHIEHVRLFINNKYYGVYLKTMRAGEPLVLNSGRLPGAFYKGELGGGKKWLMREYWKTFGDVSADTDQAFAHLLKTVISTDMIQANKDLRRVLNYEVYAKWAALMIVTGSIHTDIAHNHCYFIDPNRGRLEPVVWDTNSYGVHYDHELPPNAMLHPIMNIVISDPEWVHRRNQIIHEMLNTIAHPKRLHKKIDDQMKKMKHDLKADTSLGDLRVSRKEPLTYSPYPVTDLNKAHQDIKDYITNRTELLKNFLSSVKVSSARHPNNKNWSRLVVLGNVAVSVTSSQEGFKERLLYSGLSEGVQQFGMHKFEMTPVVVPMVYTVKAPLNTLKLKNAITGKAVSLHSLAPHEVSLMKARTIKSTGRPEDVPKSKVLGPGEIVLKEDIHTSEGQVLEIAAGTTIKLKKGVGIYSRGPTYVKGTKEAPVVLMAADSQPWACFGVSGKKSAGSRFTYMTVGGGSVGKDDFLKFKGMFSVYGCPDVILENCHFKKNYVGDDTVNLAECKALVKDCVWENARADALDLDQCDAIVENCIYLNSGNDGLDVMNTVAKVVDCRFVSSQDKGMSVGEGSRVYSINCLFEKCEMGVQVKDGSRLLLVNATLTGNKNAVHSYQKKWSYPQMSLTVLKSCHIEKTIEHDLTMMKNCGAFLVNTKVKVKVYEKAQEAEKEKSRIRTATKLDPRWFDNEVFSEALK